MVVRLGTSGYAVVDVETTGLSVGWRNRIVEVAVVLVDASGQLVGDWSTLVNPGRDVGPVSIHGIRPRDLVDAPVFADIAGELAYVLRGHVVVAHNLAFDAQFLRAEYAAIGCSDVPIDYEHGICTMQLATRYLPSTRRSLVDCCRVAGWSHAAAHSALADAHAAARLLGYYLHRARGEAWVHLVEQAGRLVWPPIPAPTGRPTLPRERVMADRAAAALLGADDRHFLARLVTALPRVPDPPTADSYLAVVDDVLADRRVDSTEADALVSLAANLGLDRPAAERLHCDYLRSLARAAWEDGVIESHERADLNDVAILLGLPISTVDDALEAARAFTSEAQTPLGSIRLRAGDRLCFTGEMSMLRDDLVALAETAGLVVTSTVSRKTSVLVCADADSLSAKARKAREAGVIVISEPKFHQLLAAM